MRWILLLILFGLLSPLSNLRAAELYFGAQAQEVGVGATIEIGVFVNTGGESVNAFEGKVTYDPDILRFKDNLDSNSIVSLWIERPKSADGSIIFSGIIPGGYVEERGYLFSIIFETIDEGEAIIAASDDRVLLNDGLGTQARLLHSPLTLIVREKAPLPPFLLPFDEDPPESFVPIVSQDANIFDGQWFVSFATQDKGSGIDHYEVRESRLVLGFLISGPWHEAESPILLEDQSQRSYVSVKAIDNAHNERIETVSPLYPPIWYERPEILGIIIGLILVTLIVWRKRRKLR